MTWSAMRGVAVLAFTGLATLQGACKTPVWFAYDAPDGSFSVRFPGRTPQVRQLMDGDVKRTDYSVRDGSNTFMIQVFESSRYAREEADALLQDYPNPRAAGIEGSVVSSSRMQMGDYPGRAVRIEGVVRGAPVVHIMRAYVGSGRMFLATVAGPPGRALSKDAESFLDSFQLLR